MNECDTSSVLLYAHVPHHHSIIYAIHHGGHRPIRERHMYNGQICQPIRERQLYMHSLWCLLENSGNPGQYVKPGLTSMPISIMVNGSETSGPKCPNHDTHSLYKMFFPNSPDMHPHISRGILHCQAQRWYRLWKNNSLTFPDFFVRNRTFFPDHSNEKYIIFPDQSTFFVSKLYNFEKTIITVEVFGKATRTCQVRTG